MDFFKSILSDPHYDDDVGERIAAKSNPVPISSTDSGGAMWSLGGLIKTLAAKSETVIQTYRRDLEEFRSGLKEETAALRTAAARVVRGLPVSLEAGAAAAQESLEAVGQAVDDLGGSVAGILSHSRGALLRPPEPPGPQKAPETSSKQYSRFEAQVLALQRDQKTFLKEPEDAGDFENWRSGFELAEKGEEIERLGSVNGILKGVIEKLVPDAVDCETFWSRYYYKIHRVKQAEDARARLIRRVISRGEEEEDLSWEVDEEEQEVKEQKKEAEMRGKEEDKVVEKGICGRLGTIEEEKPIEGSQGEQGVELMVGNAVNAERNGDVSISKLNEKMQKERKVEAGGSKLSIEEEDDFDWDEIEDLREHDEKREAGPSESLCNVDLCKRLSAAEEYEVLSWDIDDDNEPIKP